MPNIRIPRLPWELWEADYLSEILHHVGNVVRIDQNTLLKLKGKFAWVCVNIDITKPLSGSITVIGQKGVLGSPLYMKVYMKSIPCVGVNPTNCKLALSCPFPKRLKSWTKSLMLWGWQKLGLRISLILSLLLWTAIGSQYPQKKRVKAMI